MALNCKPGDLARIIADSTVVIGLTRDTIVTVHNLPPARRDGSFRLPDGINHGPALGSDWLVEFPSAILVRNDRGGFNQTRWAACADRYLRPITPPPESVTVDEVTELYSPSELVVVQ